MYLRELIPISILDIIPTNGQWSTEDSIWFSDRVVNHQFVAKIKSVAYDGNNNPSMFVSLVDTTHPNLDIYIERQLVNQKRAAFLCV